MVDVQDYELLKAPEELPPLPPPGRPAWLWPVVAAMVVAIAAAVYVVFGPAARPTTTEPARAATAASPAKPLGSEIFPVDVPPLDQSDPIVRELVKRITSNPRIAAWLATDGLIRTFTVGVQNAAEGTSAAARFGVLRPRSGFETVGRAGDLRIAPASYTRYDDLADAMASIDPAGAARLYATLKPRIEEAYRDLGFPDSSFDRALERAIVSLLQTPVPDGVVRLEPKGIGYAYVDPRFEGLTGAQKQLLRTGPKNVRTIQASLRRIALALGIPAERLPPPQG
jgi:Protein of unknown function (DUF3014)